MALSVVGALVFYPNSFLTLLVASDSGGAMSYPALLLEQPEGLGLWLATSWNSTIIGGLTIAATAPLSARLREIRLLGAEIRELSHVIGGSREILRVERETLRRDVKATLSPIAAEILAKLKDVGGTAGMRDSLAAELKSSVSGVIQPFVKKLRSHVAPSVLGAMGASPSGENAPREPIQVSTSLALRPGITGILAIFYGVNLLVASQTRELTLTPGMTAIIAVVFAGIYLYKVLWKWALGFVPTMSIALASILILAINLSILIIARLIVFNFLEPGGWTEIGAINLLPLAALSVLISAIEASNSALAAVATARRMTQTQTMEEKARLARDLWHLRRQAALFVHGRVQSALIATAMKLAIPPGPSPYQAKKLVEQVVTDLRGQSDLVAEVSPLASFFEELDTTWNQVVSIDISIDQERWDEASVGESSIAMVKEIIREAVTNSVLHGDAGQILVTLERFSPTVGHLVVADDGKASHADMRTGFGTEVLEDIALSWSRKRVGNSTVLDVVMAL